MLASKVVHSKVNLRNPFNKGFTMVLKPRVHATRSPK